MLCSGTSFGIYSSTLCYNISKHVISKGIFFKVDFVTCYLSALRDSQSDNT
jgi:hypothetical protein